MDTCKTRRDRKQPIPRAIVEWPEGIDMPARIYPLGESLEQSSEIEKVLREKLAEC
jgi:hypothetical protein